MSGFLVWVTLLMVVSQRDGEHQRHIGLWGGEFNFGLGNLRKLCCLQVDLVSRYFGVCICWSVEWRGLGLIFWSRLCFMDI